MAAEADPSAGGAEPAAALDACVGPHFSARLRIIRRMIPGLIVVLVAGVGYWQVVRSAEYVERDRRQTQRRVMMPAPRGVIYDREHRVLAGNRSHTRAVTDLGKLRSEFSAEQKRLLENEHPVTNLAARARFAVVQRHLDRLNAITGRNGPVDAARLERAFVRERMQPFVLMDELSAEEFARLSAALDEADPVKLNRSTERWYPHGSLAAHVLGRVKHEVIRTAIGRDFPTLNYIGTVGDGGIEKQFETRLHGRPGDAVVRVDAWNFPVGDPLERRDPTAGGDVVLSLDLDLQLAAERAMAATPGGPGGAAVALSVTTGEILAMASKPDFDLNEVSPVLLRETKQRIDAAGGWFNRATQGLYPPGSTFKLFTVMAGLRGGTLRPDDRLNCPGFLEVGGHRFPCHEAAGHGSLSLRDALAYSCNVFAYQTGLAAGAEALAAEARRFHFNEPTGIELLGEARQMVVPDPRWKETNVHENWNEIDTANLSIGQGFLRYSPLQAACAMASLARQETLTVPTLLFEPARRPTGDRPAEPLGLAGSDYAALKESMQAVIRTGIGQNAQVPGVSLAGKSGTAQVMRKKDMMNVAWFVVFAPVEKPEIAVAVAMEGNQPGVEFAGAEHAAPIVREIVAAYFDKRAKP